MTSQGATKRESLWLSFPVCLIIAVVVALVAASAVLLSMPPLLLSLFPGPKATYPLFAFSGFVTAIAFVAPGTMVSPVRWRVPIAVILFTIGAGIAGQIGFSGYNSSPAVGLFELAVTLIGGGTGIALGLNARKPRVSRRLSVILATALPTLAFVLVSSRSFVSPNYGDMNYLISRSVERVTVRAVRLFPDDPRRSQSYVWVKPADSSAVSLAVENDSISLEWDIGSGGVPSTLVPIDDIPIRRQLERQAMLNRKRAVDFEITNGDMPAMMRHWPVAAADFSRGSVYLIKGQ